MTESIHTYSKVGQLEAATITGRSEEHWTLEMNGNVFTARRAADCLLEPEPGDRVLIVSLGRTSYILSVLERANPAAGTISLEGDMHLLSRSGDVTLSGSAVELRGETLKATGATLESRIGTVRHTGDRVEAIFETLIQRCRNAMRWVEDTEMASMGNVIQQVRKMLNLRSENAIITARKDIKVDGERIHMG
ncbi:MAG: DUF3540 domain-containing protein [Gammaproteobacteria bacterium]